MLKLYTAPTPNGWKASIALEELGIPYAVEHVEIDAPEHPTPEFLQLTPNHKIPVIQIFGAEVERLLGVLDRILEDGRPFLAGEYSIGDIMHYGWLSPVRSLRAPALMKRPRVLAWVDRIGERPAVQRGLAVPKT